MRLTRYDKIERILNAYNFNNQARDMASCNRLYIGSQATAILFKALGGDWPNADLVQLLASATDKQLNAGLASVQNILVYSWRA